MAKIIVWLQDTGVLSVTHPSQEALDMGISVDSVAKVMVEPGKPYSIIEEEELTAMASTKARREDWTADENALTDGHGADYGIGSENLVVGWENGEPVIQEAAV